MSRFKVLLIDDEEELVFTLVERLKLRDIDAKALTSGSDALEIIDKEGFDVVVADVKMPKMGGLECLKKIKAKNPNLPVILLTGHGSQEDQQNGWDLGAFDYLMKPITIDVLIEKMQRAVDMSKGQE